MKDLNFLTDSFENREDLKKTVCKASSPFLEENTQNDDTHEFLGMVSYSEPMQALFCEIKKLALRDVNILITGESGTGKELLAHAIHKLSKRSFAPIATINCATLPADLLESELFGHEKGAFLGAVSNRKSRFELNSGGIIFLDEVSELPLYLQIKLLKVMESKKIYSTGGIYTIDVDTQVIAATSKDLEEYVRMGLFHADLYNHLDKSSLKMMPLRERKEDILPLLNYFLKKSKNPGQKLQFSKEALDILLEYFWPGNVRELEHLVERLLILKGEGIVDKNDLPEKFFKKENRNLKFNLTLPKEGIDLKSFLNDLERLLIDQALKRTSGNKNQASKLLRLNRTTLIEKMKKNEERGEEVSEEKNASSLFRREDLPI